MDKHSGKVEKCQVRNGDPVSDGSSPKQFSRPNFIAYDPNTQLVFPPPLARHVFRPLALGNNRKRWYRPVTLKQLLEIKSAYPSAKVIGGSTETQIEIKFKAMHYSASVYVGDIAELRIFRFHDDHLEIGGNVTLTDLETICLKAIEHYGAARGQPFQAIHKQIHYFAGRQIRNVGTPAGNLATASPISDLNPVFVATNTTLVVKSLEKTIEIPMSTFFKGYRTTALPADAVIASLRIPLTLERGEVLRAYKQSKRKDDDIAIVNAALRVLLDQRHHVKSVNLVFGGMAAMTTSATAAVKFLQGRKWASPSTLDGALDALDRDFGLGFGVPGGMATYRRSLALGFFYKFYHEVLSQVKINQCKPDIEVQREIERCISFGSKDHDAALAYEKRIVGRPEPHVAALKQCTGEAQYTDDIPVQKNELYGCMVLSKRARAKILAVDAEPALDLPGVCKYIDHKDLPNEKANQWGAPRCDEVFFAVNEVFTAGQPIGMVLADSPRRAEAGSRAVVVEYEDLPAIFTIEEAVEKNSYHEHFRFINKGTATNGTCDQSSFDKADHVFSGVTRMGGQEHFYLETQACVVIPKPEDGEIEVFSSTQNPSET